SPHAFSCRIDDPQAGSGRPKVVHDEVVNIFGTLVGTPVVRGRTVTIGVAAGQEVPGWAVAQYLVAQSDRLGIHRVSYAGWTWSTGKDGAWKHGGSTIDRVLRVDLA